MLPHMMVKFAQLLGSQVKKPCHHRWIWLAKSKENLNLEFLDPLDHVCPGRSVRTTPKYL